MTPVSVPPPRGSDGFRGRRRGERQLHLSRGPDIAIHTSRKTCVEAFGVCTRDGRHGRALEVGPNEADLHRHRVWMSTDEARRLYRRRKGLVEPVFGIIKEQQGARRFLLRGVANVAAEWTMLATTFNLRTLWRVWKGSVTSIWSREWSSAAISSHCQTTWP